MASVTRPHAVIVPYPAQGHINAMMPLVQILYSRGFYITFFNTQYVQERLLRAGSVDSLKSLPGFRFETFPDGLPPEHGRTSNIPELHRFFSDNGPLHLEKLMNKLKHSESDGVPPVTCIISDGAASFSQKIARKLGVPGVAFWAHSVCGVSAFFFAPLLVEKGYLPLKDESCLTNGYMEQIITCIPGMPPLRVKDLPSHLLGIGNLSNNATSEAEATLEADFVIFNTFEELDRPILDGLRNRFPPLYTIGPVGLLAESINDRKYDTSASMWTEETDCVKWLDCQEPSSVIYVCFGSITVMSGEELLEIAWGLEASKQPFLWVIRPDLIDGPSAVLPAEFLERVNGRSFLVRWAPQMKVLSHPSVGGFLTHNGWNSTLESISAGVPMISRPSFSEQLTNRRFVTDVWKIGLALNEVVKREHVEDVISRLMRGEEGRQIRKRVEELRDASITAVGKGGSSYNNLEKFLAQITGDLQSLV